MPRVPEAGPEKKIVEEGSILGITPKNWGYLFSILMVLYVCLGLYYYGLMTIAVETRGAEYMKLPTRFYGDFDRDNYYVGFGAVLDKKMEMYPWILEHDCSVKDGETTTYPTWKEDGKIYTDVCVPDCDHIMYNKCEKDECVMPGTSPAEACTLP
jgi:hypothetical protein